MNLHALQSPNTWTILQQPNSLAARQAAVAAASGAKGAPASAAKVKRDNPNGGLSCAKGPCTLTFGDQGNTQLSAFGKSIVDNAVYSDTPVCENPIGCYDPDKGEGPMEIAPNPISHDIVRMQDVVGWMFGSTGDATRPNPPSMAEWIANYSNVCDMAARMDPYFFSQLYVSTQQSSDGTVIETVGVPDKNFFDGSMTLDMDKMQSCVPHLSLTGWLSADLCANFSSDNSYTLASGFKITETASIFSHVNLFGLAFPILQGTAVNDWQQQVGSALVKPDPKVKVVQPNSTSDIPSASDHQHFEGPAAVFPVGPVPLTISSYLDASMGIGSTGEYAKVPLGPGDSSTGKVGETIGANATVDIGIDAGIDLLVLSAGVEGDLQLLNLQKAGGEIYTEIAPAINDVTVHRTYGVNGTIASGSLKAYVEVDLIIYTKRWDVDIATFGGYPVNLNVADVAKTAQSVAPNQQVTKAVCKQ